MGRLLIPLVLIALAFWVVSFVDCAMQPPTRHRGASKKVWVLITIIPVIGGVLWWTIGRARGNQMTAEARPVAPDDDPTFSQQLAEDLTSETFLRALRRMDSFSWQGRDIAAWFITIARNLITDNAKSARFRMEVTTADMLDADTRADAAPDTEVLERLRDERLLAAVRTLKPEQAECVVLRFLQGLSLAETAKVLGKTEGAVKQLQLRAVRSLHRELADADL